MFLPYRADIQLFRFPYLTVAIMVICCAVYFTQYHSRNQFHTYTANYCDYNMERIVRRVLQKVYGSDDAESCYRFLVETYAAADDRKAINDYVTKAEAFASLSNVESRKLVRKTLTRFYGDYELYVPKDVTSRYWYNPEQWSIFRMFSSGLAHGDFFHLLGNMLFFLAFSATVEIVLGMPKYLMSFAVLSVGTSVLYSLYSIAINSFVPTLGLSGVVFGFMGLFVYFLPTTNIRCILWLIFLLFRFGIPAWLMVLVYFGLDAYKLVTQDEWTGGVNLIAHVSGGAIGYLMGVVLFRGEKKMVIGEQRRSSTWQGA